MWARYAWSASDCKRFSVREIEEMKKNLTDEQFNIFWLGKPYPMTNTVVPVQAIRKQSMGYEKFKYDPKYKIGKIIFGVDYGMTDKTVLVVLQLLDDDTSPIGYSYRCLDCLAWQGQQYDNVHEWLKYYANTYKPDYVFVDLNPKGESERSVSILSPLGFYTQPINLGQERSTLQTRMKYIFEHAGIIVPQDYQELLNNIKTYTWDKNKNDDYVTAIMLALKDIKPSESYTDFYYKVGRVNRRRSY
jgi:hypothetical protein